MSAISPEDQAKFDQASKAIADNVPSLVRSLYMGFCIEGFSELQSLELCKVYILGMLRGSSSA